MFGFLPFILGSTGMAVVDVLQGNRRPRQPGVSGTASWTRLDAGPDRPGLGPKQRKRHDSAPSGNRVGGSGARLSDSLDALLPGEKVLDWLRSKNDTEAEIAKDLQRVTLGLAIGTVGVLVPSLFLLQVVGALAVVPTVIQISTSAYRRLRDEGRITGDALSTVFVAASVVGGFFYALSLGGEFIILVRWLAVKSESHSKRGIIDLFGQHTRTAWVEVNGMEVEIPLEQVKVGDLITVQGGQTIPTDGVVVKGHASVDKHMLTGEAQPVDQGPGDSVLAATVVRSGRLVIRVEKAGEDTTAAQVARMLTNTADYTSSLASRAGAFNDRMALPFIALSAASLPFIGLSSALAVLQATPGYRMVFIGPLAMLSHLHVAAEHGILIKDGRALESVRDIDTVVFDKTGTLTTDQPHVCRILPCDGFTKETILTLAAAAEAKQSHPIARAIVTEAEARGIELPVIDAAGVEVGLGISAMIDGSRVLVGSKRFMELNAVTIPPPIQQAEEVAHEKGNSLVLVAVDDRLGGGIELEPTIRPEAHAVIAQLRALGLRMLVMSGDREAPTRHLARALRLDGHFAEVLPGDKANMVKRLQAQGRKVCFVGDGINDSIALKSANVSVSLSGATTIAVDTAQIVLMEGNLTQLPQVFEIGADFAANMRVNFLASTLPCLFILGGALFLGLGLLPSIVIYQVTVPFAMYNTLRPLLQDKRSTGFDEAKNVS